MTATESRGSFGEREVFMIETTNPEIDVNQLMERVRQEAAKVRAHDDCEPPPQLNTRRSALPMIPEIVAPPVLGFSRAMDPKLTRTETRLEKARRMIEVSPRIPKMFRGFFRRQGGFNRAALETLNELAKTNLQLNARVRELTTAIEKQSQWLRLLSEQRQTEAAWMKAAGSLVTRVPSALQKLPEFEEKLADLEIAKGITESRVEEARASLDQLRLTFRALQGESERLQEWREALDVQGEHLRNLQERADREANVSRTVREELENHGKHLRTLQHEAETLIQKMAGQTNLETAMGKLEERHVNDSVYIKGELSRHNALLHQLRGAYSDGPEGSSAETGNAAGGQDSHRFDPFYLSFENRFRGSRSEIKERIRYYLAMLREANAGERDRPVLDLGCGRGEWLELLAENGMEAAGVDLNYDMTALCRERNLAVTQADAVQFLRQLPEASQGAISGFHIIEHLPFETLMDLLGETRRVLKPGGLAIFESPNCKNIVVGASNFYSDPTHRNPVFPDTAAFLLETHGFERVWIDYRSPVKEISPSASDAGMSDFENWFYGPRDFAVIGYRPRPS